MNGWVCLGEEMALRFRLIPKETQLRKWTAVKRGSLLSTLHHPFSSPSVSGPFSTPLPGTSLLLLPAQTAAR